MDVVLVHELTLQTALSWTNMYHYDIRLLDRQKCDGSQVFAIFENHSDDDEIEIWL
jgi:hypothetical protein